MSALMSARKFYKVGVGERKSGLWTLEQTAQWGRRKEVQNRRGKCGGGFSQADNGATIGRSLLARRDLNFEDFGEGEKRERKR